MTTLREWFATFYEATGESVEDIVFAAPHRWPDDDDDDGGGSPPSPWAGTEFHDWDLPEPGKAVAVVEVSDRALGRVFYAGYGGNESPTFTAWSPSYVLFNDDYDGAESLRWVPRDPTDYNPTRPGGG